jgi:peptide/nickel transport system permease protein
VVSRDRPPALAAPTTTQPLGGSRPAAWRRLPRLIGALWQTNTVALCGGLVVLFYLLTALVGPLLVTKDPNAQDVTNQLRGPSLAAPFGTDHFGRDILARTVHGTRASIGIALAAVTIATAVGLAVGALAGYFGGWADQALMRYIDLQMSFPSLVLFIIILAFLGNAIPFLILALAIGYMPSMARIARGSVLAVRQENYIMAARASGESDLAILARQILPNAISPVVVQMTLILPSVAFAEAGLSFIGLGPPPPAASWGRMISDGRDFMLLSPWEVVFPGLAITLAVLGFNFLGDGIRDLLDPRYRNVLE